MPESAIASGEQVDTSGDVDLRLPADTAQLPVLRAAAATVVANVGFDVDEIADTRMLIDELCSMLVRAAVPGSELRCRLRTAERSLTVHVSAAAASELRLPSEGLHQRILETLADSVHTWSTAEETGTVTHLLATTSGTRESQA